MDYYQVAYMPFIKSEYFEFGDLQFWPFKDNETKNQLDREVLEYLEWYLSKYVNLMQEPLDITLVSYKSKIIGPWTDEEIQKMYDTIAILSMLSTYNNSEFSAVSTDNFTLYIKNFTLDSKALAISAGNYINTHAYYSSSVADRIIFVKPESIPSWGLTKDPWLQDKELFNSISKALVSAYEEEWFTRIIRSVKIYNMAYYNSGIGMFERILLLVSAFEALFSEDTSSQEKFARTFVNTIGCLIEDPYYDGINKTLKGFAMKLYEIRSKYSHGQHLPYSIFKHDIYGDMFKSGVYSYGLSVKSMLRQQGFVEEEKFIGSFTSEDLRILSELIMGLLAIMKKE